MLRLYQCILVLSAVFILNCYALERRAIFNMMKENGVKDQFHPATSNMYSAKDDGAKMHHIATTPSRPVMRVGNEVVEVEEWILSGSPEFYQDYNPTPMKRDRQMYASRLSNLKHSMRNRIHRQNIPLREDHIYRPQATGSSPSSFTTPAPMA